METCIRCGRKLNYDFEINKGICEECELKKKFNIHTPEENIDKRKNKKDNEKRI